MGDLIAPDVSWNIASFFGHSNFDGKFSESFYQRLAQSAANLIQPISLSDVAVKRMASTVWQASSSKKEHLVWVSAVSQLTSIDVTGVVSVVGQLIVQLMSHLGWCFTVVCCPSNHATFCCRDASLLYHNVPWCVWKSSWSPGSSYYVCCIVLFFVFGELRCYSKKPPNKHSNDLSKLVLLQNALTICATTNALITNMSQW